MHRFLAVFFWIFLFTAAGCASTEVLSLKDLPAAGDRAKTQEDDDVRVTVTVLTRKESRALFGVPLAKYGIQPVWIDIVNKGAAPYYFYQRFVDENYFSPEEAAHLSRYRIFRQGYLFSLPSMLMLPVNIFRYSYLNEEMAEDFHERAIQNTIVLPEEGSAGFIFTPLDKGTKKVRIRLLGQDTEKNMLFTINVPDIKQDYKKSDVQNLYTHKDLVDLNLQDLQRKLETMECCTANRQGTRTGDPMNLVIISGFQSLLDTFTLAQWDETEALSFASAGRMMNAFLTGSEYRYSPVSSLYFQDRKHDVAFQKTRDNIDERLHLRLWLTPYTVNEVPVWVGQISRDIGIRLTRRTWNLTTHKIDPDIDESRDYLFADLSVAQRLSRFGYVSGVGEAARTLPRRNLTGDPFYTDGLRLVIELTDSDTKPVFMGWKFPLDAVEHSTERT